MTKPICVLGDDRHLTMLVAATVRSPEYKIVAESSGRAALELSEKPVLYVVAEELADINGIGFIAKLRQQDHETPVVFVTRVWEDRAFYKMMRDELNVSLVVHRPLRTSVFGVQLRHLLNDNSSAEQPQSSPVSIPHSGPVFERLRLRFMASLPGRRDKIEPFLESAWQGNFDAAKLDQAITAAHNLKGTSLSWALDELGAVAERMESLLRQIKSMPEECGSFMEEARSLWSLLNECLDTIAGGLDQPNGNSSDAIDTSRAQILLVSTSETGNGKHDQAEAAGYDIIRVGLDEAIEKASSIHLDAVVIDLPEPSRHLGLAVARGIRDVPGCENLPLAFLSDAEEDDRVEARHAGGSFFMGKPVAPAQFEDTLLRLVAMREGGRFRVLVVDDDEDLAALTCGNLGQFGILTRQVTDPLLVEAALNEFKPDMALLDVHMPGMSGFEICRSIRESNRWRDLPVLFLTAQTDLASRLTAYEVGGDDYLPKPVISAELLTRVKVRLERSRELKERSERDLLTGLLLRRAFCDQFESLTSAKDARFSLALLDLDRFKQVNDTYGHQAGDEVLSTFGRLLRRRFRVEDLRARWGGEEFIVAFVGEGKDVLQRALMRVMDELKAVQFSGEDGSVFNVTFSGGIAEYPAEETSLKELVKIADRRLYVSKDRGRQQVTIED